MEGDLFRWTFIYETHMLLSSINGLSRQLPRVCSQRRAYRNDSVYTCALHLLTDLFILLGAVIMKKIALEYLSLYLTATISLEPHVNSINGHFVHLRRLPRGFSSGDYKCGHQNGSTQLRFTYCNYYSRRQTCS